MEAIDNVTEAMIEIGCHKIKITLDLNCGELLNLALEDLRIDEKQIDVLTHDQTVG